MKAVLIVQFGDCPNCKKEIEYGKNYNSESEPYIDEIDGDEILCPHCNRLIQIAVKFTVTASLTD